MSLITTVMLTFSAAETETDDDRDVIARVNAFWPAEKRCGFVVPGNWDHFGGDKPAIRAPYVGGFNYFEVADFVAHLRALSWRYPEDVQLFVYEEHDDRFREVQVFAPPAEPWEPTPVYGGPPDYERLNPRPAARRG